MKRPEGFEPVDRPDQTKRKTGLGRITPFSTKSEHRVSSVADADLFPASSEGGQGTEVPDDISAKKIKADSVAANKEQRKLARSRRRIEKQELRRFTKNQRKRRIWFWSLIAASLSLVTAMFVIVFSPILAVKQLIVTGTERIDNASVVSALANQIGTPLPLISVSEIEDVLKNFTTIQSYSIERQLPNTLVVNIIERTALLSQQTETGYNLYDGAGVVLAISADKPEGYPVLFSDNPGVEAAGFSPAVSVLVALPKDLYSRVDSITASTKDDVTFRLQGSAQQIIWGDASDVELKATLLSRLLQSMPNAQIYDISSPNSPSVR